MFLKAPPKALRRGAVSNAVFLTGIGFWQFELNTLRQIAWFFTKAGAFVFGSGLAIVPFLHGGVVNEYHWLTEHEFIDAVAVAMITPGPVVITVGFIGYLVAGFPVQQSQLWQHFYHAIYLQFYLLLIFINMANIQVLKHL